MKSIQVKNLMVPLEEYAKVSVEATFQEALLELEKADRHFAEDRERHREILAMDQDNHVIGKLSQWDVLRGIEPSYRKIADFKETSRYGFSPEFIKSMLDQYGLWRKPLEELCKTAARIKMKDVMVRPTEGEYVDQNASLDEAIHLLVMGHHQSLLVMEADNVVGVLRLADVFKEVCERIKRCEL